MTHVSISAWELNLVLAMANDGTATPMSRYAYCSTKSSFILFRKKNVSREKKMCP